MFMKLLNFKGLTVGLATLLLYRPIHQLPSIPPRPTARAVIVATPVDVGNAPDSFRLAGAWKLESSDRRLRGLSGLAARDGQLAAITDLGAAIMLPLPLSESRPATFIDLREGPGPFGFKVRRDAEAVGSDGQGGWLVAYEQFHSVWRYDRDFRNGRQVAAIDRPWARNSGVEAIASRRGRPVVFAQDGDEVLTLAEGSWAGRPLATGGWQVADASTAPNGVTWLLLRRFGMRGFENALAPMVERGAGFVVGRITTVPKGWSDNMEGLAITTRPDGLRFWLISDDGHRIFARTLLLALDLPQAQESARR